MTSALTALLCRTSDRIAATGEGARALAGTLGERLGVEPKLIGTPGEPGGTRYEDDLRQARGCLLEAGGQVEDALGAGQRPVLLSSDCSICVTTLPVVARLRPEALILWLDAHPDLNAPKTTTSGFLGGMCLAGACGSPTSRHPRWRGGWPPPWSRSCDEPAAPAGRAGRSRVGRPRGRRRRPVRGAHPRAPLVLPVPTAARRCARGRARRPLRR